jgi:hypothetical protein
MVVGSTVADISKSSYSTMSWLPISQPETLMAALVENGQYPNIFFSNNLANVPTAQFDVNWWYRNQLELHLQQGQHAFLVMNGVLARADVWMNGTAVAQASELQGAYSRFEYDVTPQVLDGDNVIAISVYRNDEGRSGYLTLDMVDWNPPSPDNWTGLQFTPQLAINNAVSVRNVHVLEDNAADLSTSDLTVKADLRNNTDAPVSTDVDVVIEGPNAPSAMFHSVVAVPAQSTTTAVFTPIEQTSLHVVAPAIWWPVPMGAQPLYKLSVSASVSGHVSDSQAQTFGIRTVSSTLSTVVAGQTLAPSGYRQFSINGQPFVVRGGGWSQDLFLRYSHDNAASQVAYIKNMGLNAIRFEGNFPPEDFFDLLDQEGILAMPGWECCGQWEQESSTWGGSLAANAANQAFYAAARFRNHPSVFVFYQGSDNEPDSAKESIYLDAFSKADWQLPQVASAEYKASAQLGPSGSKEGPYNYAPPDYWWESGPMMATGDMTFTNAGGAFGFDTETSPGNTVPTVDSLNRFLSATDQAQVWDVGSTQGAGSGPVLFHDLDSNYTEVGTLGQYNTPLWNRYGPWTDMATYQREAQAGGYEITRAIFEAYIGHAKDAANPSTGIIYWQMNKAWPSLEWELYGYDFDQGGVFFGAQKANEPVHVLYAYDTGSVKVANLTNHTQSGLQVRADFIDMDGSIKGTSSAEVASLVAQDVQTVLTPAVPAGISSTYFLRLVLSGGAVTISRNVYWLSTGADGIDWANSIGSGSGAQFTPGGYANLTGLQKLAMVPVTASATVVRDGGDDVVQVSLGNTSAGPTPAFLARLDVRRGSSQGTAAGGDDQVLPILWSENYVTLWPQETATLTARYAHALLSGGLPVVALTGWNVVPQVIAVGGAKPGG